MKKLCILLLATAVFFSNCKKEKGGPGPAPDPAAPKHLISKFTYIWGTDTSTYHYEYDAAGWLVKVEGDMVLYTFEYGASTVTSPRTVGGMTTMRTFWLKNGLAERLDFSYPDGSTGFNLYERNPDGTVKTELAHRADTLQSRTDFTYDAEGNWLTRTMTASGEVLFIETYQYGPESPANTVITGRVFYWPDPPRLPVSSTFKYQSATPTTTFYAYELDAEGRVAKKTASGATSYVELYEYLY